MTLITDKPEGLAPTPNDLDRIPDDLLGPHPASIRLGQKDLLTMDKPPLPGETIKVQLTLYHKRGGYELVGAAPNKEMVYHCGMVLIKADVVAEPYVADEDPPMIERDLSIPNDYVADGTDADDDADDLEPDADDEADESGLDEFNPAFSHNGAK